MANLDRISAQPWDAHAQDNQIAPRSLRGARSVVDGFNQRREDEATIATTVRREKMIAQQQAEQMLATYESGQRPDQALDPKIIALWERVNKLAQDPEWKDAITDLVRVFGDLLVDSTLQAKSPQSLSTHALQVFEQALNAVTEWKTLYSPHIPIGPEIAKDFVNPKMARDILAVWERSFASANQPALGLTTESEESGKVFNTAVKRSEFPKALALVAAASIVIALLYVLLNPPDANAQENVDLDPRPPVPAWISDVLHADAVFDSLGLPHAPDLQHVLEARSRIQEKMEQSKLQQQALRALVQAQLITPNGRIVSVERVTSTDTEEGNQIRVVIADSEQTSASSLAVGGAELTITDANKLLKSIDPEGTDYGTARSVTQIEVQNEAGDTIRILSIFETSATNPKNQVLIVEVGADGQPVVRDQQGVEKGVAVDGRLVTPTPEATATPEPTATPEATRAPGGTVDNPNGGAVNLRKYPSTDRNTPIGTLANGTVIPPENILGKTPDGKWYLIKVEGKGDCFIASSLVDLVGDLQVAILTQEQIPALPTPTATPAPTAKPAPATETKPSQSNASGEVLQEAPFTFQPTRPNYLGSFSNGFQEKENEPALRGVTFGGQIVKIRLSADGQYLIDCQYSASGSIVTIVAPTLQFETKSILSIYNGIPFDNLVGPHSVPNGGSVSLRAGMAGEFAIRDAVRSGGMITGGTRFAVRVY